MSPKKETPFPKPQQTAPLGQPRAGGDGEGWSVVRAPTTVRPLGAKSPSGRKAAEPPSNAPPRAKEHPQRPPKPPHPPMQLQEVLQAHGTLTDRVGHLEEQIQRLIHEVQEQRTGAPAPKPAVPQSSDAPPAWK
eukprot:Sspe_Gene.96735::Locus_69828_Transcript_1_1_Confidence_1.000_Length_470::g.96735::m.96735